MAKKIVNGFVENRKRVQEYFLATEFLVPLNADNVPYEITEDKNKHNGKLASLIIDAIPISTDENYPTSWVIDLEKEGQIFSAAQGIKKGEKALAFLSCTTLYFVIIEMKETLEPYGDGGLQGITDKIAHSISRLAVLLPIYLFDTNENYKDFQLIYKTIVVYNKDNVSPHASKDETFANSHIYKVFSKQEPFFRCTDKLGKEHKTELFFVQNLPNSPQATISLATIFENSVDKYDFDTCQNVDLSCP